jgi:hypothetical protein
LRHSPRNSAPCSSFSSSACARRERRVLRRGGRRRDQVLVRRASARARKTGTSTSRGAGRDDPCARTPGRR